MRDDSPMAQERDYVLGTHEEELARLGLQHRVWRRAVLDCWQRAGLTVGKRVLDLGAGPGYAAIDLAEIVGPTGEVTAVERSSNFVSSMRKRLAARGLTNVHVHELDLMLNELPAGDYDFSWCRWVLSFVSDPALLIGKLASVMRRGTVSIFHEYGHYDTWRFVPPLPSHEKFRAKVIETWLVSGGIPDGARPLPPLLAANGFTIRSARPLIFAIHPRNFMWQWPQSFIDVYCERLLASSEIDHTFSDQLRTDFAAATNDAATLMLTPLVLEVVAEKIG